MSAATVSLRLNFAIRGPGRPTVRRLPIGFAIRGPGTPARASAAFSFAMNGPEPTVFFFNGGDWQGSAQRAMTPGGWWPPTL